VIRSAGQVQPGDRLVTTLHEGQVVSRVEQAQPAAGVGPAAS
jgi:hypothetical protein